jgi:hypothetical protein
VSNHQSASLDDTVCVSSSQVASRVGDEVAILDLDHSVYYGLDPVGARIWALLEQPARLDRVLAAIVAEFEVEAETARADLLELVDELLDKGLVERRPSDAA